MRSWRELDEIVTERNKEIGKSRTLVTGEPPWDFDRKTNELASEDLIRHFADAIGDLNPLWRNETYARKTVHSGIIAPPTFLYCIASSVFVDEKGRVDCPSVGSYNAGCKWERFREVHAGDKFTVVQTFRGFEIKRRNPGLVIQHNDRTYTNQDGQVVAIAHAREIEIERNLAEEGKKIDIMPGMPNITNRHRYTEQELEAIYKAYDDEKARGSDKLYWEDIAEGEELPSIVKGPLDVWDIAAFFAAWGASQGFGIKKTALQMYKESGDVRKALDTSALVHEGCLHFDDNFARLYSQPIAVGVGAQSEAAIAHLITNWMGDDGFLKELDCQARRINPHGDTTWAKGKITKKYIENSEHLVELEVRAENQDGIIHMPGKATVRLLSKTGL